MQPYNINEIIALVTAVAIGGGAYVTFVWNNKLKRITLSFIVSALFISSFLTYVAAEGVRIFKLGEYRTMILPPVAFLAHWFIEWLHKKHPQIFSAGLKKTTGIDLVEPKNNKYEQDIQEREEGRDNP